MIECDLHEVYGVDVVSVLDTRTWRWLQTRIVGLLNTECRLQRYFAPPEQQPKKR